MDTQITKLPNDMPIRAGQIDPASLVRLAESDKLDVDKLERLIALAERGAARMAHEDYTAAIAAFRAECPPVPKLTTSQFTVTRAGRKVPRMYADLDTIQATIDPVLSRHRLSYHWSDMVIKDGQLTRTCVLSHAGGHSVTSSAMFPVDSNAGNSGQQKVGSADTYARRYSLAAVVGVRGVDVDDDGDGGGDFDSGETITEEQAQTLNDLVIESATERGKFLRHYKITAMGELPAAAFDKACELLNRKIKEAAKV